MQCDAAFGLKREVIGNPRPRKNLNKTRVTRTKHRKVRKECKKLDSILQELRINSNVAALCAELYIPPSLFQSSDNAQDTNAMAMQCKEWMMMLCFHEDEGKSLGIALVT